MRRAAPIAVVVAALVAIGAPDAQAATPPTLTGVGIAYSPYYDVAAPRAFSCQENPDGGATVRISVGQDSTSGPYPGARTSTIDVTLGPAGPDRRVVALEGSFSIDSPSGQVSATLSLGPSASGTDRNTAFGCGADGGPDYLYADFRYTATITTGDGVFVDRGRGTVDMSKAFGYRNPIYDFSQRFTSDISAPETVLFGQHTPGGSFSAMSANTKRASPFVLWKPATVRKLFAYVDGKGATSGQQTIRAVLYRNASGLPAAYVTRSFDFTVPAGMTGRWVPLYLAPPAQLGPGVYWLGVQSGGANGVARFGWNSKAGSRRFNVDAFGDGASDPFGTALADDQQLSIFAAGSY